MTQPPPPPPPPHLPGGGGGCELCTVYPCDENEVKAHIIQLKESKSLGPNSVPTNILHLIVDIVSLPMSQIFHFKVEHTQKS